MERKAVLALTVSCCLVGWFGSISVAQAKCNLNEAEMKLVGFDGRETLVCYRANIDNKRWDSNGTIDVKGAFNLSTLFGPEKSGPVTCLFEVRGLAANEERVSYCTFSRYSPGAHDVHAEGLSSLLAQRALFVEDAVMVKVSVEENQREQKLVTRFRFQSTEGVVSANQETEDRRIDRRVDPGKDSFYRGR
jgi:hypothetical protein